MVKCFVSDPHLMPFHLSSSQVDPSHSTAGLTVALMRDYLYTRTLQTFLCRSPIKLEQISGMGDSCKWEEKVILSDPWHPWFKQGDQRLLSNCLSFIYVNQINWTLILRPLPFFFFFFIARTISAIALRSVFTIPHVMTRLCRYRVTCDVI